MSALTVTAKGQVTLRKELLKHLGAFSRVKKSKWRGFLKAGS
jgi:hypothetical protein